MQSLIMSLAAATVNTVGGDSNLVGSVIGIINAIVAVLGIVCVIVMIIGGISYMTSAGDAGKVKKGKDTILYGLIGLVICAFAFAIVNFVIANIIGQGSDTDSTSDSSSNTSLIIYDSTNIA